MPGHAAPQADHASGLTDPTVRPAVPWRVADVYIEAHGRLGVRFNDGTEGTVDLTRRLQRDDAGVFAALRDPAVFGSARVDLGAVSWPGGIDLAPDAMYDAIRAEGVWVLT